MALIKWYDDEEQKKEDLFAPKQIASVQSTWQPTMQNGGSPAKPQSYLMSDEKAQVDNQIAQRKAAEAQAAAQAAAQAQAARQYAAAQAQAQQQQQQQQQAKAHAQAQVQQPKEYKPKNAGEAAGDFFQGLAKGLWKGGAGAIGSGASIVSSLLTGDADNDVTNATKQWQKAADDWGNSVHANGVGESIGNLPGGIVSGIVDPASYMVRGVRNTPEMIAASIAAGSGDKYTRQAGIDMQKELQARQFGDDVAKNGDAAMLMEGIAKPGAAILNVVTAGQGAKAVEVPKAVWQRIAASAAKEGIINVGAGVPLSVLEQAARGQEITWESVGQDALLQGVTGATIGGLSQGYAISKNRGGVRENASQLEGELTPEPRPQPTDGNITFEPANAPGSREITLSRPLPATDTYVPPRQPTRPAGPTIPERPLTPEPRQMTPEPQTPKTPEQTAIDEVRQREQAQREQPAVEQTPVRDESVQPTPEVADGVVNPQPVLPDMPETRPEQVRALQEARVGKSQAEEAVINQELQQLEAQRPAKKSAGEARLDEIDSRLDELDAKDNMTPEESAEYGRLIDEHARLEDEIFARENAAGRMMAEGGKAMSVEQDPLASLKQEALKYKTAEEFANSLNAMKYGKVTGVGQLPIEKINKTQIKALTERGLPHTDTNLKVSDFKPGRQITQPLEVYSKGGSWVVENGNHRLAQALANGDKTVPVVFKGGEGKKYATSITDLYTQAHTPQPKPVAQPKPEVAPKTPVPQAPKQVTPVKAVEQPKVTEAVTPVKEKPAPTKSNLPDDMTPVGAEPVTNGIDIEVLKRGISKIDAPKEMKGRIARAVGKELDTELPLSDILDGPKVSPWLKDKITTAYNKLEKLTAKENAIQARGIKSVSKGVIPVKDVDLTKRRNNLIAERGRAERNLLGYVKQLEGRVSKTARLANITENVVGSKNTNQLTSAALLERNATQELGGNIQALITNPVAFTKGLFGSGSAFKSAGKSALMEWTVTPKVISDAPRYLIGNLYNTLMTPSTALARHRRGMHADASARMILETAGLKNPSQAEIRAYSALQGAENEALVNTMVGVFNGMSSRTQANRAADAFAEFIKTGSDAAHKTFLKNLEKQTTLAKSLMDTTVQGLGKNSEGQSSLRHEAAVRIGSAYVNMFLPYLSNVTNLTKTAVSQTLNPLARSTVDQILKSVRSKPENIWAIVKQKSGDYGMLAGVGMMISAGAIGYNDGEEVDKPRGVYIDLGDDRYIPIRATHVEVPVAAAVTAGMIAKDIASGDMRDAEYYAKIMTASLPYLDSIEQHASAVNSLVKGSSEEGDNMYGAKAWAINQGRSFVPLSNNSVQQWSARNRGESLNAKKVYDKDMGKWFTNAVRQNYDPAFRDSLEDSRDAAGRVRTVDNQGSVVNKRINDQNTKTYNDTITDLVTYARQNKLGKGTQDMFNTYPDGKNNNFKSVQDKITFLDAPEKDGKKTPDNATKLEPNDKLYDLSQQIYNGFFGDSADELLTLDGTELRSDVAVPGKNNPGKNTNLPISIASIRNAIAQTDLPQEDWDKLNSISEAKSAIAERAKAGEIGWSAYYDALPEFSAQENAILANSPGNQRLSQLMNKLRDTGFFEQGGLGSTRSGQTYLWNSLNAMLGDKGKTPAAEWADSGSGNGFTPWGRGGGRRSSGPNNIMTPAEMGTKGIRWTPTGKRQMASVKTKGYTPFKATVKLDNAIRRDRTQNYADRSI